MKKSVLILTACAAVLVGCGGSHEETAKAAPEPARNESAARQSGIVKLDPNSPALSQIHVAAVEMADVAVDEVDAPGKIEVNPNKVSHVVLPLAGRVAQVMVHIGDTVQRGQTVLLLESPDADAAIGTLFQAEGSLNIAASTVLKAEADAERARDLLRNSAIAQKEVLAAGSALTQAKAAQENAKAVKEQSLRRLALLGLKPDQYGQKIEVKAPISGKVLELSVAPNEYRNDTNASLMTLADLSDVWVSSDVPETKIRLINPGEKVTLQLSAYPDEQFTARVTTLADTVDPATRTVKVHAELKNPNGRLRPEMFGRIRHVDSVKKMPVVPMAALAQGEGQTLVYRQKGPGEFEGVTVQTGNREGDRIGIVSGLNPGDMVVTDGVMLLKQQ